MPSFTQGGSPTSNSGAVLGFPKYTAIIVLDHLSALANSQTYKLNVPHGFRVEAVRFRVNTAVTTAAKGATLTTQINGTALTGGVITLTSANCTPVGAAVAGTTITATNTGSADTTVEIAVSGVTAFAEGGGVVELTLSNTDCIQ